MKVVVQNLQKRRGLGTQVIHEYEPDIFLAQEILLPTESEPFPAHNTSHLLGFGTAIYHATTRNGGELVNIRLVDCPHAEVGGFIYKKTTIADYKYSDDTDGTTTTIQFVSFHGYNGWPFQKDVYRLVDHVQAVIDELEPDTPCVFAGDFNTWTEEHLAGVQEALSDFVHAYSWPYPGRELPLDHVFLRGVRFHDGNPPFSYRNQSDHGGAVFELTTV